MKILHIATDDKFLDHAFPIFEKVYPGANDVYVISAKTPLKYVKLKPDYLEKKTVRFINKKSKLGKSVYLKYDLIVFHSLGPYTYPEIINIPEYTPTIWLGWGFDYYKDLLSEVPLHLEETYRIFTRLVSVNPKRRAAALVRLLTGLFWPRISKVQAVENITVFAPVLPKEYDMVKSSRNWRRFPKFASWNYGTMEDNFIKGFEGESITGDAILVGNSATYTGNHLEALNLLHKLGVHDRQIVAPLSYGDPLLAKELTCIGQEYFSDNFEALIDFMPIQDYLATIKKCGYVIMNHVRQQAVGNIVIMLYLGARVFVRQENPVYDFLRNSGVAIFTIQQLSANPELLNEPLTEGERFINRSIVSDYWSRERAYERTRKLVEAAFAAKCGESPALLTEG